MDHWNEWQRCRVCIYRSKLLNSLLDKRSLQPTVWPGCHLKMSHVITIIAHLWKPFKPNYCPSSIIISIGKSLQAEKNRSSPPLNSSPESERQRIEADFSKQNLKRQALHSVHQWGGTVELTRTKRHIHFSLDCTQPRQSGSSNSRLHNRLPAFAHRSTLFPRTLAALGMGFT